MKNITVAVPDDVYRAARVHAAEQGSSVSALVRDFLWHLAQPAAEPESLLDVITRVRAHSAGSSARFSAADRLSRDEVHARGLH